MPKEKTLPVNLSESELLSVAFNCTEAVRFIVSKDGGILNFNRKAFENATLLHDKTLKKGDNLFDYANDPGQGVENSLRIDLERAFAGEAFLIETEIPYGHGVRWFQTEYVPILHKLKIIAVSINIYEITEKKNTDTAKDKLISELQNLNQNLLSEREMVWEMISKFSSEIISSEDKKSNKDIIKKTAVFHAQISALRDKTFP